MKSKERLAPDKVLWASGILQWPGDGGGAGRGLGGTRSPEVLLTAAFIPAALSLSLPIISVSECGLSSSCTLCLLILCHSLGLTPCIFLSLCLCLPCLSLPSVSLSLSYASVPLSPCLSLSPLLSPLRLPRPLAALSFCLSTPSLFLSISVTFLVPLTLLFCFSLWSSLPHFSLFLCFCHLSPPIPLSGCVSPHQPVQSR